MWQSLLSWADLSYVWLWKGVKSQAPVILASKKSHLRCSVADPLVKKHNNEFQFQGKVTAFGWMHAKSEREVTFGFGWRAQSPRKMFRRIKRLFWHRRWMQGSVVQQRLGSLVMWRRMLKSKTTAQGKRPKLPIWTLTTQRKQKIHFYKVRKTKSDEVHISRCEVARASWGALNSETRPPW